MANSADLHLWFVGVPKRDSFASSSVLGDSFVFLLERQLSAHHHDIIESTAVQVCHSMTNFLLIEAYNQRSTHFNLSAVCRLAFLSFCRGRFHPLIQSLLPRDSINISTFSHFWAHESRSMPMCNSTKDLTKLREAGFLFQMGGRGGAWEGGVWHEWLLVASRAARHRDPSVNSHVDSCRASCVLRLRTSHAAALHMFLSCSAHATWFRRLAHLDLSNGYI